MSTYEFRVAVAGIPAACFAVRARDVLAVLTIPNGEFAHGTAMSVVAFDLARNRPRGIPL